jgi:serine/threonine protein kinase
MALATPTSTPQVLGDYEVLDKIGEGSMSTVHKGRHRETGAVVAIKILLAEYASNKVLRDRLHQEFRAASLLRHPHLVRAIDGGQEDGTSYLVMEYVAGEDLWQRIERDGPLPEAEAVRIITQVAKALDVAHARGFIHRDVKPDNILLTTDGQAKLADLGLAKDRSADVGLTRPQQGLGTPNFMAPEQFADAKNAGIRCDVYSLAATLYMAVTGKLPFEARNIAAIHKKKANNELVPPRQLVPDLSERVDWAIRRALRAKPEERSASCLEFANALTGQSAEQAPSPAATAAREGRELSARPPAAERRLSARYACTLQIRCDRDSSIHPGPAEQEDCWDATVENLAAGGLGLRVRRRFEPGTLLTVNLCGSGQRPPRTLEMRVTRVRRGTRGSWYHGCVFAQPLSADELRKLL